MYTRACLSDYMHESLCEHLLSLGTATCVKVEPCGIGPVRQCAGHHLPSLLAINKHILGGY